MLPTISFTLHSPSTKFIGTPFADDDSRFEYPFPSTSASDPSHSFASPIIVTTPAVISPGPIGRLSSSSLPFTWTPSTSPPLSSAHFMPTLSAYTHPKLRRTSETDMPVPPGRMQRPSLVLFRKRSSSASQLSVPCGAVLDL